MIGVLRPLLSILFIFSSTNLYSQAKQVTAADTAFYQYLGKTPSQLGNIIIGSTNLLAKDYWDARAYSQLQAIIDKVAQMDTINHNNFTFAGFRKELYYDIISFFPVFIGGANLLVLNDFEEVLDFTTDDTASNKVRLPTWFAGIDSIEIWVSSDSTLGDSVAFAMEFYQRADGDSISGTFTTAIADTLDLGTSARKIKRMVIKASIPTLVANRVTLICLRRVSTITNNQAGNVSIHEVVFFWK